MRCSEKRLSSTTQLHRNITELLERKHLPWGELGMTTGFYPLFSCDLHLPETVTSWLLVLDLLLCRHSLIMTQSGCCKHRCL